MTDKIRDFLLEFKQNRDFSSVQTLLVKDAHFRHNLLQEIGSNCYPFAEYASWIAEHFFRKHPDYLFPDVQNSLKKVLLSTKNHTVQRNLTHIFADAKISIEEDGELLELFLIFLTDKQTLPALKLHAYHTIDRKYLKHYPELLMEVQHIIDTLREDRRPSIQHIVRRFDREYSSNIRS